MRKRERTIKQQNNDSKKLAGIICLLIGAAFASAILLGWDNLLAQFPLYLLGKCALLLPVVFFVAAFQLFYYGKLCILNKKTLGVFGVMLCLLGTAHHVFIPVNEELTPHLLPDGGGLIGGLVALLLHKTVGEVGTYIVLFIAWLVLLLSILPVKSVHKKVKALLFGSDIIDEEDLPQEVSKQQVKKSAPMEAKVPEQRQSIFRKRLKNKPVPKPVPKNPVARIYDNNEFDAFTEGLEQKNTLQRILKFPKTSVYENEKIKEELERDPIQIADWQPPKQPIVIVRPIINYDDIPIAMPKQSFLSAVAPEPQHEQPYASAQSYVSDAQKEVQTSEEGVEQPQSAAVQEVIQSMVSDEEPSVDVHTPIVPQPFTTVENDMAVTGADTEAATVEDTEEKQPGDYQLPTLALLNPPKTVDPATYKRELLEKQSILEKTLVDYKVKARVTDVTRGPSVTRFELEPEPGVKVSSIINLAEEFALWMSASSGVRIEAPIPGKSAIGLEVPNAKNEAVAFSEVVSDISVAHNPSKLCIGLGKDISGNIIAADLSKMPHLLVAGSTGSGKSVCINTIIAGILYKARPDEVKLILVDPKVVELSNYNGIPHLLTPVVTEPKKAASALHWAVAEMERRYQTFADSHVREINSYNAQAKEKMPFIVIIIDELSDLMMTAKVDVEEAILRLAQKARAAGIHLIIATQRPSVDVITGIVKANIPSRIAFAVSSQTDSRTILDMGGAEKLLGKGDMLFSPIGLNKPVRVQGAFVSDAELNKIVDFIVKQSIPVNYSEEVTSQELACDSKSNTQEDTGNFSPAEDELFEDAVNLVLDMGQASSSMLQRRFRIGYTRAARLVDTMEELGIVGQSVGSKPREVIMSRQEVEERFLKHE